MIGAFALLSLASVVFYMMMPMTVETMTASSSDVYDYVTEDGVVISDQQVRVSVQTSGTITSKAVKNGQVVDADTLLVSIDDRGVQSQIDQLTHQIESVSDEKNLNLVSLKYQIDQQAISVSELTSQKSYIEDQYLQAKTLYESGATSEAAYKEAKSAYDSINSSYRQSQTLLTSLKSQYDEIIGSDSSVASLEAQLSELQRQASYAQVFAGASGLLTDFTVNEGDYVVTGTPIALVVNPEAYKIETYVLTEDVYNLSVGDDVDLEIKRNGETTMFRGKIHSIDPTAVERLSTLGLSEKRVRILIEAPDLKDIIKIGYDVKVNFISEYQLDAIAIPKTSIFYYGEDAYVFKIENGKAVETKIETTMETDDLIVVSNGIGEGDILIKNYKIDGLVEGKRVSQ